jgi:CDP-diacylglycerol--glycerol-3-phosphate 3-phosphatidyltransferase
VAAILFLFGNWQWALVVFILVAATDKLDGYVARSRNSVTKLGEWLDPLADKVLVGGTLVALSIFNPWYWMPSAIILIREIDVSMMRRYAEDHNQSIPVTDIAKVKTFVQCTVIAVMFLPVHGWFRFFVWALVAIMLGFTIFTWFDYRTAFKGLFGRVTLKALYWR